jgi:hypothetical protein
MHTEILTEAQIGILGGLSGFSAVGSFYLAGGTALALRHGHRRSIDFDFFRQDAFDGHGLILSLGEHFDGVEQLPSGEHTVHVRLDGVSASFFRLPYPLLESTEPTPWGFGLASDADIAAMKLEAIAGRGSRKDFVDLRLLCQQGMTIDAVFALFERKYGTPPEERYHRLRALAYFEDAERQPMPDMLRSFDWEEAKRFFTAEATRLLGQALSP